MFQKPRLPCLHKALFQEGHRNDPELSSYQEKLLLDLSPQRFEYDNTKPQTSSLEAPIRQIHDEIYLEVVVPPEALFYGSLLHRLRPKLPLFLFHEISPPLQQYGHLALLQIIHLS